MSALHAGNIPAGSFSGADELAALAGYIFGTAISVDGGMNRFTF